MQKSAESKAKAVAVVDGEETKPKREPKVSDKRKADTDCKNDEFETHLRQRRENPVRDFQQANIGHLATLSQGRPP